MSYYKLPKLNVDGFQVYTLFGKPATELEVAKWLKEQGGVIAGSRREIGFMAYMNPWIASNGEKIKEFWDYDEALNFSSGAKQKLRSS